MSYRRGPRTFLLLFLTLGVTSLVLGFGWLLRVEIATAVSTWLPTPFSISVDCWFKNTTGRNAECFYIFTRYNHANPRSSTVRLPVVRFSQVDAIQKSDPILFLPGGPGHPGLLIPSVTSEVWELQFYSSDWLDNRAVIVFDYRGTGLALPSLACPELDNPTIGLGWRKALSNSFELCKERIEGHGIDLTDYSTSEISADVADIRTALGIQSWNLWAESYGTRVAFDYLRRSSEGIRSVILAGVYPPNAGDWRYRTSERFLRLLNRVFQTCADDSRCQSAHPEVAREFWEAYDYLKSSNLTLHVESVWPKRGTVEVLLDDILFLDFLYDQLSSESGIAQIPNHISGVTEGNRAQWESSLSTYLADITIQFVTVLQLFAVNCNDLGRVDPPNYQLSRDVNRHFVDWEIDWEMCGQFRENSGGVLNTSAFQTPVPALLLAGEFDPATPVEWAQSGLEYFSESKLVIFPTKSHDILASKCAQSIARKFLMNPSVPPDASCIGRLNGKITFAD
jgi:pimeloyl-ACP methyl ester carboxylesterase